MRKQFANINSKDSTFIIWILRSIGFILVISLLIPTIEIWDKGYIAYLGSFGDAINGITAPFIGTLVAILTFMAFIVQYQANESQRNDIKIERFESKFYEMIRLHRENVGEIEIEGIFKGREAIEIMYEEFRFLYKELEIIASKSFQPDENWLAKISYYHFFRGTIKSSSTISTHQIEIDSEKLFINSILKIQEDYDLHINNLREKKQNIFEHPYIVAYNLKHELKLKYKPFKGYSSKLGHYFRHLYQSIKLAAIEPVLNNSDSLNEFNLRYQYIKLIRVQLSNTEQSMIYFNSFFSSGLIWWEDNKFLNPWKGELSYFIDYAIIKNIPLHQIRDDGLGPDPEREFNSKISERESKNQKCHLTISELFEQIGG